MRLINADALLEVEEFEQGVRYIYAIDVIKAPTVDAEPVIHARWVENLIEGIIKCSNCGEEWSVISNCCETFDRCPHCGAKMDLPDERLN